MDSAALCPPWHESRGGGSCWSGSSFASLLFALATFARTWTGAESKLTVSSGMSPWYFLMKSANHFSVKPLSANSANARQNDGRDGTSPALPHPHSRRESGCWRSRATSSLSPLRLSVILRMYALNMETLSALGRPLPHHFAYSNSFGSITASQTETNSLCSESSSPTSSVMNGNTPCASSDHRRRNLSPLRLLPL